MSVIRQKRLEAQLTMTEVAKRACMPLTTFWKIEHGEREARMSEIPRLARALGCNPGDLFPVAEEEMPTHA